MASACQLDNVVASAVWSRAGQNLRGFRSPLTGFGRRPISSGLVAGATLLTFLVADAVIQAEINPN